MKNSKVLIIEDVITTGKSSLECSKIVTEMGSQVVGFACIIDRTNGKSDIKENNLSGKTYNRHDLYPTHHTKFKNDSGYKKSFCC